MRTGQELEQTLERYSELQQSNKGENFSEPSPMLE